MREIKSEEIKQLIKDHIACKGHNLEQDPAFAFKYDILLTRPQLYLTTMWQMSSL